MSLRVAILVQEFPACMKRSLAVRQIVSLSSIRFMECPLGCTSKYGVVKRGYNAENMKLTKSIIVASRTKYMSCFLLKLCFSLILLPPLIMAVTSKSLRNIRTNHFITVLRDGKRAIMVRK